MLGRDDALRSSVLINSAILLTPPQPGAIATIRLNGPLVDSFIVQHLAVTLKPLHCTHCQLRDGDTLIDDPVAVRIAADCVELHVHGGPWIIRAVLELLGRFGFDIVDWQTAAAEHWIDSADAIERQMLADVHRAGTREALAMLLAQPKAWQAMLDSRDANAMRRAIGDRSFDVLLNPPTVAIVGLPNVGKSTLANCLFARSHSITADLPGTTRDWVGERANVDGLLITLVDTPGQRDTTDPIEAAAIGRAIEHVSTAQLILLIEDATGPDDVQTRRLRDQYPNAIRVLNKCDLPGARIDPAAISVSAKSGEGLDQLRATIRQAFGCKDLTSLHARCLTDAHRQTLANFLT